MLRELNKTVHILGLAQAARPPKTVTIIITTNRNTSFWLGGGQGRAVISIFENQQVAV